VTKRKPSTKTEITLLQYTEISKPGGVRFLAFNIDPDFANCIDGLVVVDLTRLKDKTLQCYIDKPEIPAANS